LLHWLYHVPSEKLADNAYLSHIRRLVAHDEQRRGELLHTLEVYLDHGGAVAVAAQALYIHRNTLLHRLERITQICEVDLRDFTHRINLHAAIKIYRLHGSE
jgi:purine catabolism regulator